MAPIKLSCSPVVVLELRHCNSFMLAFRFSFAYTSSGQRTGSASMQRHSRRVVSGGQFCDSWMLVCVLAPDPDDGAALCMVTFSISSVGLVVRIKRGVCPAGILSSLDVSRGPS